MTDPTPSPALTAMIQDAIGHHRAGRFAHAELAYREVLRLQPEHADALHMLGLLSHQCGHHEAAITLIGSAIASAPTCAMYSNLGVVHHALGQFDAALQSYEKALDLNPHDVNAVFNMGNVLRALGQYEAAISKYRVGLVLYPNYALGHNTLGVALKEHGQLSEAALAFERAIALAPAYAEAYSNLGATFDALGKHDAALNCCLKAVAINPHLVQAHNHLGMVHMAMGNFDAALLAYGKAVNLDDSLAQVHNNLGNVFHALGKLDDAIASFQRAVDLNPVFSIALNNLGAALRDQWQLNAAVQCYQRAIALDASFDQVHSNLGVALMDQGHLERAMASFRIAIAINPKNTEARSNQLFAMSYLAENTSTRVLAQDYGKLVTSLATPYSSWPQTKRVAQPLKVGLVSGDLRAHPVGFFLAGILPSLDPQRVQLVAYVTRSQQDALTLSMKPQFASWKVLAGMSDEAVARMIYEDGIHILIDLAGHTAHNRLPLFAWKAAPVQVSWLGYFDTTGVTEIDFILVDRPSVPQDSQDQFTESVWYLPETRLCFSAPAPASDLLPAPPPVMQNGYITFGSFQNLAKINHTVLNAWSRILHALPRSRLRLQCRQLDDAGMRDVTLSRLNEAGISSARVTLVGSQSRRDYLIAHREVDAILDTFPYPGGTTTCEALWMGVPCVTLAGHTLLSRQGASLLHWAGLSHWVVDDVDAYVARAVSLALDTDHLRELRLNLREALLASALFDSKRFASGLQDAFEGMWNRKMASHLKRDSTALYGSGGCHENSHLPALDGNLVGENQQKKTTHLVIDSAKNHTSVDFRVDL